MAFEDQLNAVNVFAARSDFTNYVPSHGISLEFISHHLANLDGVETMRDLEAYTRKVTERFHSSFAELLRNHDEFKSSVAGTADYFVSFAYDTKVDIFVDALNRFRRQKKVKDLFVWISILTVNQHFLVEEGHTAAVLYPKTWFKNAFEKSIASIRKVLFILSPISKPVALQRLWCIYELYLTVSKGYSLDVCLSELDELTFMQGLLEDTASVLKYIEAIDSRSAAADPSQERKLRDRIEDIPGSYGTLDTEVRDKLREWFAHSAKSVLDARREDDETDKPGLINLLNIVGKLFFEMGNYEESENLRTEALYESIGHYGNEHLQPDSNFPVVTINVVKILVARILKRSCPNCQKGRFEEAEELLRRSLEIHRKQLGEQDYRVAMPLSSLGIILNSLGRPQEAEPYMREALQIDRNAFGNGHQRLAVRLNNLAQILTAQGDLDGAEPLMREALEITRRTYGQVNPELGSSLSNLAALLKNKGDLDGAEPIMREALEMDFKAHGKYHPKVAISMSNLGVLLLEKGYLNEAEKLLREALDINTQTLGKDHYHVAVSMNNLAQVLRNTGDLTSAEKLLRQALDISRRVFGSDHPMVATRLLNLAAVLKEMGDILAAESLAREALAISRSAFGSFDVTVASHLSFPGMLLKEKGDINGARLLIKEALAICRNVYGESHQHTLAVWSNLEELRV